jgi:flagellar protein FlaF
MHNQLNKLYRQTQMDSAPAGRQIEVSILELATAKLRSHMGEADALAWSRELDEVLKFNQKVWDVFSADWMSSTCKLERSLRENLLSIAVFVKKKTFKTMADPKKRDLDLLIQLNENIVDGLRAGMESRQSESA